MKPGIHPSLPAAHFSLSKASIGVAYALMLMQTGSAYSQERVLPPVIVTADPAASDTLPSITSAMTRIQNVAGGANIVDAEQYKEGRVSTLDDALRFSPGVFIASRFGAEEARLSIRGSGLQRTFHMRGIQLLQDGVPLNLADGSADFQAVEPLSARYVEVYRGANALQFGSTTLGGAVNFVSPSGLSAPRFGARVEAGSFGYHRLQASTGGASEQLDWFIAANHFGQDGFRDHSKQNTQRISGNLGWQLSNAVETRFFLQAVKTDSELPGALTQAEMKTDRKAAAPGNITGDQKRDFDLVRLSNLTTFKLDPEQRFELGTFYAYKSLLHPINQVVEQDSDDYGINARFISEKQLSGNKNRLIVGATIQSGDLDDDRFINAGGERGARQADSKQRSKNYSVFAENQHYFIPSTAFILGAQAVEAKRELDDRFLTSPDVDNSVDKSYRRVSPKIGLLHELAPQIQIYGNVSGSYEPPTFGELAGGSVPPVELNAQRARTIEAGTRGTQKRAWGDIQWDFSVYHARVKDELLSLSDGSGNPARTVNADKTIHQGIEAGIEANIGAAWTTRASYMLNDFRFKDDPVYGDKRLAGVPKQLAVGELLYKPGRGFYLGPNVRIASSTYVDHANTLKAAGYGILGFKVGQQLNRQVSWFIDGRNLTDKNYSATTGVAAEANAATGRYFYPGDGRSVYAGLELKY